MLPNVTDKISPDLRSIGTLMMSSPDQLTHQAGELLNLIALLDEQGQGVPSDVVAVAHTVAYAYLLQGR